MSNVAVILAGGVGNRLGLDYPKQFAKVAGKQLIEHTLEIFQSHPHIDEILVVTRQGYAENILELVNRDGFSKVTKVVNGGDARTDSTRAAIVALDDHPLDTNVMFHDAVRPFLSHSIIDRLLAALDRAPAVDVVINSADTLVEVNAEGYIESIPDRSRIRRGQTPQAFKLGVIRDAYELLAEHPETLATCDCSVVHRLLPAVPIATVEGDAANIKVTEPIDMFLADKLFQSRGDMQIVDDWRGLTGDRLAGKVVVVLGGASGIGEAICEMARGLGAIVHALDLRTTGTDVGDPAVVKAAFEAIATEEGRIDFVALTAGILIRRSLNQMEEREIEASLRTNLLGAFVVARAVYPFLEATRGSLLFFTSSSYTRGRAFYSAYSATKAAIVNLTQALAEEWAEVGIKVNCLNPERTATPMRRSNFGYEPPETLLRPERVAEAALAVLVSGKSGHIVDVRLPKSVPSLASEEPAGASQAG